MSAFVIRRRTGEWVAECVARNAAAAVAWLCTKSPQFEPQDVIALPYRQARQRSLSSGETPLA